MNILILSNQSYDPHSHFVGKFLRSKGANVRFLYSNAGTDWRFHVKVTGAGSTCLICEESLDDVDVVYAHRIAAPRAANSSIQDSSINDFINKEWMQAYWSLLFYLEKSSAWVNPLHNAMQSNSKIVQLIQASRCGFNIPDTLFSNFYDEVLQFYNCKSDIVFKCLMHHQFVGDGYLMKTPTSLILEHHIKNRSCIECAPSIYQELIAKKRI